MRTMRKLATRVPPCLNENQNQMKKKKRTDVKQ